MEDETREMVCKRNIGKWSARGNWGNVCKMKLGELVSFYKRKFGKYYGREYLGSVLQEET